MIAFLSPMPLFTIATLLPVGLIGVATQFGGAWVGLAVVYLTLLTTVLDRLVTIVTPATTHTEFPAANGLSAALAISHFALMAVVVWALSNAHQNVVEKIALFFAAGLFFGQISNANAHELIHRTTRPLRGLGMWVYISLLFGHHTSAHVLVHHRNVATLRDPNTSRKGESFYRFAARAWLGSFREGYKAETARLVRVDRPIWHHPYVLYIGGGWLMIGLAFVVGGMTGMLVFIGLAAYAQMQLLLSDYVQHYGLLRALDETGKPLPVTVAHSWNSPHWFSSALMLNATRHSDHHAHPARPYPALTLPKDGPMLPKPLPLMACIALCPPLWRRIMDPLTESQTNA